MEDLVKVRKDIIVTRKEFVDLAMELKTAVAVAKHLGCGQKTVSRAVAKYFPELRKGVKLKIALLELEGLKEYLKEYREEKTETRAEKNKKYYEANREKLAADRKRWKQANPEKVAAYHKKYQQENPGKVNAAAAKRRAKKLQRTPSWADHSKIQEIYLNCPEGYQVDHIIPLQGERVSGLHVENNLQYLTAHENHSKSNKYEVA